MIFQETVFVFGSNLMGRHGKGAALHAKSYWGAKSGCGRGRTGRAYALPTKDERLRTLSLERIEEFIAEFFVTARATPETLYLLTPVGCGLAGYKRSQIWPILRRNIIPGNVMLTPSWVRLV